MKRIIQISQKKIVATLCGILCFSGAGFAQEASTASVVNSDNTLFLLLLAFIVVLLIVIMVLAGAIKNVAGNKEMWSKKFNKTAVVAILTTLLCSSPISEASAAQLAPLVIMTDNVFYLLVATISTLFLIAVFLGRTLNNLLNELSGKKEEVSILDKLTENLTESVPIEREAEVMTDHNYDGIRELDNVLPPWWVYLFYATIIFGVVYLVRFHVIGSGDIMGDEYRAEMELAMMQKAALAEANPGSMIDENNVTLLTSQTDLDRGKSIFNANCASCHKESGGGDIGPNLTDQYWLHGGSIAEVFSVIKYGVQEKGMISWQSQIKPDDMQRISSYILSLQGSNPIDPKEPQGELYVPASERDSTSVTLSEPMEEELPQ